MSQQIEIEAYLLGKLSAEARSSFENQLETDKALQYEVEMERALQRAALEARLKPMVEQQFAKHRPVAQWRYQHKFALAAGVLLFGLFSSSLYTRWMFKTPISIDTGYAAASHTLDAVMTTQLDTFEALQTQLKKVIHSLRDENLESNLLKINQLPNESQDLIPYFKALAYLKAGQLPTAKDLLNGIVQYPNHPKNKEAISLLETMK